MRLGPRGAFGHHPPHGPSRTPRRAGYLERSASAVVQSDAPQRFGKAVCMPRSSTDVQARTVFGL
jgi:hypothetical protein